MSNVAVLAAKRELITGVKFHDLRLPYDDAFADAFEIDNIRWKVLIDTVYPAAKSSEAIAMALSYCKQRNLDPFKRPVHIVPMWSTAKGAMIETVWPGISELRTTATRTSEYAGCDAAEFGPTIKREFKGKVGRPPADVAVTVEFPEWCQITVHRVIRGQRVPFVSPKVYWVESYGRQGKSDVPNDMWCKRPVGQIEKCAEAAALRRAFPEEIGNEYTAEEMEGQILGGAAIGEVETPKPKLPPPPPPAPATKAPPPPPAPVAPKPQGFDFVGLRDALRSAPDEAAANAIFDERVTQFSRHMSEADLDECDNIAREAFARFQESEG